MVLDKFILYKVIFEKRDTRKNGNRCTEFSDNGLLKFK